MGTVIKRPIHSPVDRTVDSAFITMPILKSPPPIVQDVLLKRSQPIPKKPVPRSYEQEEWLPESRLPIFCSIGDIPEHLVSIGEKFSTSTSKGQVNIQTRYDLSPVMTLDWQLQLRLLGQLL